MLFIGLSHIDRAVIEAARLDGAATGQQCLYLYLPLLTPTLLLCVLFTVAASMRVFREAYLLFGAYPMREVYLFQHFLNNHFEKLNNQLVSAASLLFFYLCVACLLTAYGLWRMGRRLSL